jgi:putative spermidine/putrescine transport system substrate-binding protein
MDDAARDGSSAGRLTRRDVVRRGGSLALSASAFPWLLRAGDALAAGESSGSITIASWGGSYTTAWENAVGKPFKAATGIDVKFAAAPGQQVATFQSQVKAGHVTYDIVDVTNFDYVFLAQQHGWLKPLPASARSELARATYPGSVIAYGLANGGGASNIIGANTQTLKKIPKDPTDFFDVTNFPGRRAMWHDGYLDNVVSALLADGVPHAKIFPLDLDRAFNKLTAIKPSVAVWYTSGDQQEQIMRDEEVDMIFGWDGRLNHLVASGAPVTIQWANGFVYFGYLVIPTKAPNAAAALKFLEFFGTNAKAQANWAKIVGYTPSNKNFPKYLSAAQQQKLWTYPPHRKSQYILDLARFAKYTDIAALKKRWYDWLQS